MSRMRRVSDSQDGHTLYYSWGTRTPVSTLWIVIMIYLCCLCGYLSLYTWNLPIKIDINIWILVCSLMIWPPVVLFTQRNFYSGKLYQRLIQFSISVQKQHNKEMRLRYQVSALRGIDDLTDQMLFWWVESPPPIHETNHHQGGNTVQSLQHGGSNI